MSLEITGLDRGISPGLARFITPAILQQNAQRYEGMGADLTEAEMIKVDRVRKILLSLPLVHTTKSSFAQLKRSGLRPYDNRPRLTVGRSTALDRSLGMTSYSFMHWGAAEKSVYGRNHLLINPQVILSANTIVTPGDVGQCVNDWCSTKWEALGTESKSRITAEYFGKVVSGSDWLEITARRLARTVPVMRYGMPTFRSLAEFGEIKHLGTIDGSHFTGYVSAGSEHEYWTKQLESGFIPGPIARGLEFPGMSPYDIHPDRLGSGLIEKGRAVWRAALDMSA